MRKPSKAGQYLLGIPQKSLKQKYLFSVSMMYLSYTIVYVFARSNMYIFLLNSPLFLLLLQWQFEFRVF